MLAKIYFTYINLSHMLVILSLKILNIFKCMIFKYIMNIKKKADKFFKQQKFNKAIKIYKKYVSKNISSREKCINLNQIGLCYFNLKQYNEAFKFFEKALTLYEIHDIYSNAGSCLTLLKLYDKAIDYYLKGLGIQKTFRGLRSMGSIYFYKKKYNNAINYYNQALEINNTPEILYDLSFIFMTLKQFDKGLKLYENRLLFNHVLQGEPRLELPELKIWNGTDKCNHLLIVSEQGLGDNILFYRYIIELSEKYPNMIITYFCRKQIHHIFKKYDNINIIVNLYFQTRFNYKLYIMSLPYILKTTSIVNNINNYISIDEKKNELWKKKLSSLKKFKIGISWKGLLHSFIEKSIPYTQLESLTQLDASIICLHKNDDIQDIDKNLFENPIHFFNIDEDQPFSDTIAILNNIDLLITIDSCLTYIAGIMNINTLLLLGKLSDWRWFNDKHDATPWYNSVKLIKSMKHYNDWENIINDTKEVVCKLIKNPEYKFCNIQNLAIENDGIKFYEVPEKETNICSIPISIGELWDKYTILLIKKKMIIDEKKQKIVIHEINKLQEYINKFTIDENKILELKICNKKLWDIEDDIREKERKKEFDDEFIKLARSVYITNDKRSKLKNNISLLFNSDILEVKSYKEY